MNAAEQRWELANDRQRPLYHFLPPANWMNDPNGLIQWKGKYHLFYQYNPQGPFHALIHWGHASSSDLVHWEDLPIALTPIQGRADADGCWSGCALDHNGTPTILYSAVHPQTVCLATSDDDLEVWHYSSANPVIAGPPAGLAEGAGGNFRDPFVWKEGGYWYLLMGSARMGVGGLLLLYRSLDLLAWEYLHPFLAVDADSSQALWTGIVWECPNLLTFGEQRMLILSTPGPENNQLNTLYTMGTFENEHFSAQGLRPLTYGGYFYAPQVMRDEQGRALMWGWLLEGRDKALVTQANWSGVMSLPIVVDVLDDAHSSLAPAPELASLRGQHWHYEGIDLAEIETFVPGDCRGACLEILLTCKPAQEGEFGLLVRRSPDGQEQTGIVYQPSEHRVLIQRGKSSLQSGVERRDHVLPVEIAADEEITLHLFLDCSVLELFVNKRHYAASRIYPTLPDSLGIELFARSGARIRSLDIWQLASIWDTPIAKRVS